MTKETWQVKRDESRVGKEKTSVEAGVSDTEEKGGEKVAMKPGRNEPCFCGSGLKFKKCHGEI